MWPKKVLGHISFEWNILDFGERMKKAKGGEYVELDKVQVGEQIVFFRLRPNGD